MDFGAEITQLLLIIVALGVAYLGITAFAKRGGSFGGGASSGGDTEGVSSGLSVGDLPDGVDDDLGDVGGKRDRQPTRADGSRFDLTGKDAEAAAKVLKRMLGSDVDSQ